jgi:hypothetical protein
VDACLQDLQGKAERVKPADLLRLLEEFYIEKVALRDRHMATARVVGQYDFNNTYQYVIARENQHLEWVGDAIRALGGSLPEGQAAPAVSAAKTLDLQRALLADDGRGLEEFVTRWRPRVASITNARNKLMLDLILGEMLEQARLFHQGAGGRLDLLGRRTGGERTGGEVLADRWVE